jgi:phage tail-like protein
MLPRLDPLGSYNFIITLIDASSTLMTAFSVVSSVLGGFTECSGLESTLDVEDYKEGGNNGTVLKFPTRISYQPLRLKRGVGLGEDLWLWHYGFVEGKGKRRDGLIMLQNDLHIPIKVWRFRRGLPTKYSGPTLNAMQSQVAIEELEITHEGLELYSPGTAVSSVLGSIIG